VASVGTASPSALPAAAALAFTRQAETHAMLRTQELVNSTVLVARGDALGREIPLDQLGPVAGRAARLQEPVGGGRTQRGARAQGENEGGALAHAYNTRSAWRSVHRDSRHRDSRHRHSRPWTTLSQGSARANSKWSKVLFQLFSTAQEPHREARDLSNLLFLARSPNAFLGAGLDIASIRLPGPFMYKKARAGLSIPCTSTRAHTIKHACL